MTSIGFHGNVTAVWEKFVSEYERTGELLVELGSDQTSCHNPYNGGYYPVHMTQEEGNEVSVALLYLMLGYLESRAQHLAFNGRNLIGL